MCGLAGWIGVPQRHRFTLAFGLGLGIDTRGGDACGFAGVGANGVQWARRAGTWLGHRSGAPMSFIRQAASGESCLMHARYATCGNKSDKRAAHPFAIRRGGAVCMWGAHNGIVYDADASAKRHKRTCRVDSEELLRCVADGEDTSTLHGYGAISYIAADAVDRIQVCAMTDTAELVIARVAQGGIVYASTLAILDYALAMADLRRDGSAVSPTVGAVFALDASGGMRETGRNVTLASYKYEKVRYVGSLAATASQTSVSMAHDRAGETWDEVGGYRWSSYDTACKRCGKWEVEQHGEVVICNYCGHSDLVDAAPEASDPDAPTSEEISEFQAYMRDLQRERSER